MDGQCKKKASGSLTREQVIDTAFALCEELGPEKTSLRRVAEELHISAMGLYTYVTSWEDMIEGVYHKFFALIDTDYVPGETDAECLRRYMLSNAEVALTYPKISYAISLLPRRGRVHLAFAERSARMCVQQGISPQILAMAWTLFDGVRSGRYYRSLERSIDEPYTTTDPAELEWLEEFKTLYPVDNTREAIDFLARAFE